MSTICHFTQMVLKPLPDGYSIQLQTIGDHLRKARMDRELLQKDVANIIGVSEDTITFWERNRHQPMKKYLPRIMKFLGYEFEKY